jgi:hypothetical protein
MNLKNISVDESVVVAAVENKQNILRYSVKSRRYFP